MRVENLPKQQKQPTRLEIAAARGLAFVMQAMGMFGIVDGYRIGGGGKWANPDKSFHVYKRRFDRDIRKKTILILPSKEGGWIGAAEENTLFAQRCTITGDGQILYDQNEPYISLPNVSDIAQGVYIDHMEALVVSVTQDGQYVPAYVVAGRDKQKDRKDNRPNMRIVQIGLR